MNTSAISTLIVVALNKNNNKKHVMCYSNIYNFNCYIVEQTDLREGVIVNTNAKIENEGEVMLT